MSSDLKQTLPSSETQDLTKAQDDRDIALSTTLIQPTSRSRQSELTRTRYWEQRASAHEPKRPASSGNTRIGLGPEDPLVQAVHAVKLQLMQATQPLAPPPPAAELPEPPVELPKRRPKPIVIAAAALGIVGVCAAGFVLTDKPSSKTHEAPALVRPAPPSAPTTSAPEPQPPEPRAPEPRGAGAATERTAVDALFAGDYALARRHYAALAQAHPEQPAFAEAARILSRRSAAETE